MNRGGYHVPMEGSSEKRRAEVTKIDAMAQIAIIEQSERVKGAIDSEPADFTRLRNELESGEISPEEAIMRARGISEGRMDYH